MIDCKVESRVAGQVLDSEVFADLMDNYPIVFMADADGYYRYWVNGGECIENTMARNYFDNLGSFLEYLQKDKENGHDSVDGS